MEAWIPCTIVAAFFQNLRSSLQKHLRARLSTLGAAYARFCYALPFAWLYLGALSQWPGQTLPQANWVFIAYCLLGGVCQILFTVTLLWMFAFRNFAVGTTFSKLEVLMVTALSALVLGETLDLRGWGAIVLSSLGVLLLSFAQNKLSWRALWQGLLQKSTVLGLVCAAWLGGSTVFFRAAALSLSHANLVMAAAYTLATSLLLQSLIMGVYIRLRQPGELTRLLVNWRGAAAVGVAAVLASIGWFTAFTLQSASLVRALGQVELIFTGLASLLFFREKLSASECGGIVLVCTGIVLLLLSR